MRAVVLAIVAPCVVGMQTIGPSTKRVQLKSSADALLAEAQVLRQEAAQEALALHIERLTSAYGEDVTPAALASVLATDEGTTAMLLAARRAARWEDFARDAGWFRARATGAKAVEVPQKQKKTRRIDEERVATWGGACAYAMPLGQAAPFVVSFLSQLHAGHLAFAVDECYRCFTIVELCTLPFVAYAICNLGADVPRVVRTSAVQALLLLGVISSLELALFLAEPNMTPLAASLSGALVGSYAVGAPLAAAATTVLTNAPADVGLVSAVADLLSSDDGLSRD